MTGQRPWRPWPLLIAFAAVLVVLRLRGYMGLTGDDFFRTLMTEAWVRDPFFATPVEFGRFATQWLPAHFWLTGALTWLTGDAVVSLVLASAAASLAGLWLVYALARELFGERAGILAALLLACVPLWVWLGVSHTEYPLYVSLVTGALWQLMVWLRQGRRRHLLSAAALMLGATLFRIEGWTLAVCFTVAVIAGVRRRPERAGTYDTVIAAAAPLAFAALWMAVTLSTYGNPMESLAVNRAQMVDSAIAITDMPVWARAMKFPGMLALTSPILVLLVVAWFVWRRPAVDERLGTHLGVLGGYLVALSAAYVGGFDTEAEPRRYTLVALALLVPLAADVLARLLDRRGRARRLAIAGLGLFVVLNHALVQRFPSFHADAVRAGRYLADQLEAGTIPPGHRIATDWVLHELAEEPIASHDRYIVITSEHAGVASYSHEPSRFGPNVLRDRYEPTERASTPARPLERRLGEALRAASVCKVAVADRELAVALPPRFRLEAGLGGYLVFSTPDCRAARSIRLAVPAPDVAIDRRVADGVVMEGYRYERALLPRFVTLVWAVDQAAVAAIPSIEISFRLEGEREVRHRRTFTPIVAWQQTTHEPSGREEPTARLEDTIALRLPAEMPSGRYAVTLAPAGGAGISLGQVPLIQSKRQVLLDVLNGAGTTDWSVVWRTIASL